MAAVLAVILFAGIGTGASSPTASAGPGELAAVAPGISPADANLLELDVIPAHSAVMAPNFTLTDQHGDPVTLARLRGKVVIWSLNDDRCTDLCALFAQSVVAADADLGSAASDVVFLSVNANPFYPSPLDTRQWSETNDVEKLPNWTFVTGTPPQLQKVWNAYKVTVIPNPATRTVTHDAIVEFIDPSGRTRAYGYFDQGSLSTSYYAHAMAQMADDLLPSSEQVAVGGPTIGSPATSDATVGATAPPFDLEVLGGRGEESSTRAEAKPLVLNFWSSTCSVCTAEMPALEQVYRDFRDQLDVVGVDVADPRSAAARFAEHLGVTYRLLADPGGTTAAAYKITGLPVTFVVSTSGQILARHEGPLTAPELEAVLEMDFQQLNQG